MRYQLGWATLPGLRGLSCSDFRATPAETPAEDPSAYDATDARGVVVEFADSAERDAFLRQLEEYFAAKRFTNAADAFDTVKAYVIERAAQE
jgi:hypothetical protein